MLSLTYVSSATELLSQGQLVQLLENIRPKNEALALTGLLLYSGGNIIQVLEGPDQAVRDVYADVCADDRHTGVMTVWEEEVEERAFPDWSMGFRVVAVQDLDSVDGFSTYLHPGGDRGAGTAASSDPAHTLLRVFRETMR